MKYQDIIKEASDYDVEVIGADSEPSFYSGEEKMACMMKKPGTRTWVGLSHDHNGEKIRFEGTKAKVANWCLDIAANGRP